MTEAQLTLLEARRCQAIATGDLKLLASLLADDYTHVLASGRVLDKQGYLELIRVSPRAPRRNALRVRVYADSAVITGALENQIAATEAREARLVQAFCTQVAVKHDTVWRFVSYILTRKLDT